MRLTTLPTSCAFVMKSGNLNFLEASGPRFAYFFHVLERKRERELSEHCEFCNETGWRFLKRLKSSNVSELFINYSRIKSLLQILITNTYFLHNYQFNNFLPTLWLYRGADKSLARPTSRCILFDGENISFDDSLVIYTYIYIYSANIPSIMIINRIYEHQNLLSL
jgi:hypothetical protein